MGADGWRGIGWKAVCCEVSWDMAAFLAVLAIASATATLWVAQDQVWEFWMERCSAGLALVVGVALLDGVVRCRGRRSALAKLSVLVAGCIHGVTGCMREVVVAARQYLLPLVMACTGVAVAVWAIVTAVATSIILVGAGDGSGAEDAGMATIILGGYEVGVGLFTVAVATVLYQNYRATEDRKKIESQVKVANSLVKRMRDTERLRLELSRW